MMPLSLAPLAEASPVQVELLLDAAFGRDRHARTAYRLRAGLTPIPALSLSAWSGGSLAGVLQSWPVALAGGSGAVPMVLVGPVAVAPGAQSGGIGTAMMRHMLAAADAGADDAGDLLVMIGDPEYYARFGFSADATGGWRLPGPWEPHRLLARVGRARTPPAAGLLEPRPASSCPAPRPA